MTWILLALFSRFLWAGCNAIDQVYSRLHRSEALHGATILNFCVILPLAFVAYLLSDGALQYDFGLLLTVGLGATVSFLGLWPYYQALQLDDAHNVVPFFEFTPVFLTVLACFIFNENPTAVQIFGGALVVLCGFLFSWDFRRGHVKAMVLGLMVLSSALYAFNQLSMRIVSEEQDIWGVLTIYMLLESVFGFVMLAVCRKERNEIIATAKKTGGRTVIIALFNNVIAFTSFYSLIHAFKLAPTTGHVAALSGTQPFFSFFIAIVLARFLPKHFQRVAFDRETKIKLGLLIGIFLGVYLLATG